MTDILKRFAQGKIWDFKGGIHPPEMKSQSNQTPISQAPLVKNYYIPLKQHAGAMGNVLVAEGDYVQKGQMLSQGDGLRQLPVHAPTSGIIKAVAPFVAPHPSGLSEPMVHLEADGLDTWRERTPWHNYLEMPPANLIERIYQAGVAGLGGAVFPTAAKIHSAESKVKLLIINAAECEPYITCDDRLMQDYTAEMLEGVRILRYLTRPVKTVIAIEDNKPQAIAALEHHLQGADDIELRVIPTKYPSGAAKQLIYLLTGMEVPAGGRSSDIGVLMHNVGTAFAIKRAVIDDEPLIERVVTFTGDKIPEKGNYWVRIGTPIDEILEHYGYQFDARFPVFAGGPMMGLQLASLKAPITKVINCLLAPDHFEYGEPEPEQSCIRCSACSDACPVNLMPQQLYWFARSEDHKKSEEYALKDCIECGVCAYVCPSHIPLIQYFRQEKAKIWELKEKEAKAAEAKIRFEAKQARMDRETEARKARTQQAAENRRAEMAQKQGEDPVQAALARLKAKQAQDKPLEVKTLISEQGEIQPDNAELMALRKARRTARQQEKEIAAVDAMPAQEAQPAAPLDPKKAAVAAALARAKAKKAAQAGETAAVETSASVTTDAIPAQEARPAAPFDPKKAAVAAALARAKAKKAAQTAETAAVETSASVTTGAISAQEAQPAAPLDPKKAAVAAAIARAKAKKAAQAGETPTTEGATTSIETGAIPAQEAQPTAPLDPKKAAVAAAIARAKAKKAAQAGETATVETSTSVSSGAMPVQSDEESISPERAAIAAAIAHTRAKKAALAAKTATAETSTSVATDSVPIQEEAPPAAPLDPKKAAVAAAIARAKAKKAAMDAAKNA